LQKHGSRVDHQNLMHTRCRVLREELQLPDAVACPQLDTCNCSREIADADDLRRLEGVLTKDSLKKVLGAANSSDPHEQTVRVNEDVLPSTFLFIGVLSGWGYRCPPPPPN